MGSKSELVGSIIVKSFCIVYVLSDIVLKIYLALDGNLNIAKVGGTLVGLVLMYFLWKGKSAARWITVVLLFLSIGFIVWSAQSLPEGSVALGVMGLYFIAYVFYLIMLMTPPVGKYVRAQSGT